MLFSFLLINKKNQIVIDLVYGLPGKIPNYCSLAASGTESHTTQTLSPADGLKLACPSVVREALSAVALQNGGGTF